MTKNRKLETINETGKSYRRGLLGLIVAVLGPLLGIYILIVPAVSLQRQNIDWAYVAYAEQRESSPYMAPFVPTPQEVVDRMLELAEISKGDVLYDLGSGDGRIVVAAAARYGVRAVGFEIDPNLVKESREAIRAAGLGHLAEIHEQDIRTVDFSPASVVTMYLYPGANLRLRSAILRQLKPGSRVVSHDFGMGDWKPDRVDRITDSMGLLRTLYLWRIREPST
jgi:SAM-dependent methyltransferase